MAATILHLTAQSFEETALRRDGVPVLVDFWAGWCAPCRAMEPMLEELAEELEGEVLVTRVDVDDQEELAAAARIDAVPTLVLLKDGVVRDVMLGAQDKNELRTKLLQLSREVTAAPRRRRTLASS